MQLGPGCKVDDFEFEFQLALLIVIPFGFLLVNHVCPAVIRIHAADKRIFVLIGRIPIDRNLQRAENKTEEGIRMRNGHYQRTDGYFKKEPEHAGNC